MRYHIIIVETQNFASLQMPTLPVTVTGIETSPFTKGGLRGIFPLLQYIKKEPTNQRALRNTIRSNDDYFFTTLAA